MKYLLISIMLTISSNADSLADFYVKQSHCKSSVMAVQYRLNNQGKQVPSQQYIYKTCMNIPSSRPDVSDIIDWL